MTAIKFSHDPVSLSATDFQVAERFESKKIFDKVVLVCPDENGFAWMHFSDVDKNNIIESWNRRRPLAKKRANKTKDLNEQDAKRTALAIEQLKALGFYDHVLIERTFASNYLSKYAWDIDAYAIVDDNMIGFEVKQKYPTPQGKFGINEGLVNLFEMHEQHGIPVWHIILTKPVWDKDFSAVTLLKDPKYNRLSLWIGSRIQIASLKKSEKKKSPNYTGLYKDSSRSFRQINGTDFFHIKNFHDVNDACLKVLLDEKCSRVTSEIEIPRVVLTAK
jgi:hypothetical protein